MAKVASPIRQVQSSVRAQHKPQMEQVSTLLYAMGDSANDILQTLQLDEGTVSYEEIKKSLNDHFAEQ